MRLHTIKEFKTFFYRGLPPECESPARKNATDNLFGNWSNEVTELFTNLKSRKKILSREDKSDEVKKAWEQFAPRIFSLKNN